jgi:hypothetical protein
LLAAAALVVTWADATAPGEVLPGEPTELRANLAQHPLVGGTDPQAGADAGTRR